MLKRRDVVALWSPDSRIRRPVLLPPGRAKLATKPEPTGSVMLANTIGIATVSRYNAATKGVA